MKGISTTLAPKLRSPADKLLAWCRARPTRIRVPARGRTSLGLRIERQVSGLRPQVSGLRPQVSGLRSQVSGLRSQNWTVDTWSGFVSSCSCDLLTTDDL